MEFEAVPINEIEPGCNLSPVIVPGESHWYAIHACSQSEREVAAGLYKQQIEVFVPLKAESHHRKTGQLGGSRFH